MKLDIGVPVLTRDGRTVGEVHRVIVDVDDKAVTAIDDAGVHLAGTKLDIEVGLGPPSRALSPSGAA